MREALPDLEFWWVETYGRIALTRTPERFEYYAAPMKKWFDVYAFPFGDRDDYQVAILFHDITARRTAESAIADYRRRLDTALIAGEVGTFEWDVFTDRLWGDQNFARMFNVRLDSSGAAPLVDYLDAIHPDDREEVQRAIETVLISGSELQCEYRVGSVENPRWIVARGKLERDMNGRAIRFPGIVLDVTERRNAESALRKNRELLTSIIDNADTAIYAKTADGKFILCNLRHAELLNRSPDEVIGKTDTELNLDIATATLFANNEKAVIAGNLAMQFEESFATPEGRRVFVSTKFPLYDAQDEVYAVCSIATDITSRKRSIEQLRRDQERVRLTQQTAGIGTFDWDIKQNINSWSPELESLYGLQPGSFDRQREPWKAFVHEEDVELAEQKVREALSKGQFQAEWRIVRPDGEVRWITARAKFEFDEAGEPIRMLGVNIDTTERELTLRALRDSEQRFRELADAMPQLVWIADDDGTVTYYNNQSQNYEGIERDADGRFVWKPVVYEDDLQLTVNTWETAVRTGQAYQCEHRIRMRDGTFRWHLSRALRVDGLRPRWYGTATDVHELKLAEHAMRESEERFRTLADNMSQLAWMADSTGAIFWFNQRWFEYTGSTPEQVLGHGWQEVHHREHLSE